MPNIIAALNNLIHTRQKKKQEKETAAVMNPEAHPSSTTQQIKDLCELDF